VLGSRHRLCPVVAERDDRYHDESGGSVADASAALVFVLLALLPMICSLLAGYDAAGKGRSLMHMLGFAVILAITIYIIIDYEYPRAISSASTPRTRYSSTFGRA
jgi:hypothetical protein